MSYYYLKTRSPKWLKEMTGQTYTVEYCKSFVSDDVVSDVTMSIYKRLERKFNFNSGKIKVVYSPEKDYTDDGCELLGSCSTIKSLDDTATITLYPEALNTSEVFFDVIKHELAHHIADLTWLGDEYYESHSDHGRRWMEVAKEIGCKAKPSNDKAIGTHFNYVVCCSCGNALSYANTFEAAENEIASGIFQNTYEDCGNDKPYILSAEEFYQKWLAEREKLKEEYDVMLAKRLASAKEAKAKAVDAARNEVALYQEKLEALFNGQILFGTELAKKSLIEIEHSSFGTGHVESIDDPYVTVVFDNGKRSKFSFSSIAEYGCIKFKDNNLNLALKMFSDNLKEAAETQLKLAEAAKQLEKIISMPAESFLEGKDGRIDDSSYRNVNAKRRVRCKVSA